MKENNEEPKIEEKTNEKKENKKPNILNKNQIISKNKKSTISTNYFLNAKKFKTRNGEQRSFMKDFDKQNQLSTSIRAEKSQLNKTLDINNNKNPIKKNNNIKKLEKRNSLYLNSRKNNINNPKNDLRKSMNIITKDNNKNKLPDKRSSFVINKKNTIRINKDKSNVILEKIIEKNEDKKDYNYNKNNDDINRDKKIKMIIKGLLVKK